MNAPDGKDVRQTHRENRQPIAKEVRPSAGRNSKKLFKRRVNRRQAQRRDRGFVGIESSVDQQSVADAVGPHGDVVGREGLVLHPLAARLLHSKNVGVAISLLATLVCTGATVEALRAPPVQSFQRSSSAQELFAWVKRESADKAVRVLFENPRVLTLETGAAAMAPLVASTESLKEELEELPITHVVVGALAQSDFNQQAMSALMLLAEDWREMWRNDVYRVFAIDRQ